MRLLVIIGCGLIAFASCADAQSSHVSDAEIVRVANEVLAGVATDAGPGVAVLIARQDKVIYRSARGKANIELGVSLSADQVFQIASITKMFTAAMVVKLAEAGELSLDDRLARFLPGLPNGDTITIRQLLDHTAGVSDRPVPMIPGFSRRDVDTATLIGEIARRPADFAAGTSQSYSNAGYIDLGAVVEKVTGQPWHAVLQERILVPLGLGNTAYGLAPRVIPGRVAGYRTDASGQKVENASFISLTTPAAAGALVSTTDDLRRWMRALVDGKIVSDSNLRQMISPAKVTGGSSANPYGLGMYIWNVRGEKRSVIPGRFPVLLRSLLSFRHTT